MTTRTIRLGRRVWVNPPILIWGVVSAFILVIVIMILLIALAIGLVTLPIKLLIFLIRPVPLLWPLVIETKI